MGRPWRDPVELPRWLHALLYLIEAGGFVYLSVIFFFFPNLTPRPPWTWVSIVVGAAVFVAVATVQLVPLYGNPQKRYVQCLLEELCDEMWAKPPERLVGTRERHRITLFRVRYVRALLNYFRRLWHLPIIRHLPAPPWVKAAMPRQHSHVLVPCLRAPRASGPPKRSFFVHDDHDESCEGIAGHAYCNKPFVTSALPDLHIPGGVTHDVYTEYARLTWDTIDQVKQWRSRARRFAGLTLYVDHIKWGVLVFDSSDPEALTDEHFENPAVKRLLLLLTAILEQVDR